MTPNSNFQVMILFNVKLLENVVVVADDDMFAEVILGPVAPVAPVFPAAPVEPAVTHNRLIA